MTKHKNLLAALVAQRMEMGETEWHVSSDTIKGILSSGKQAGSPRVTVSGEQDRVFFQEKKEMPTDGFTDNSETKPSCVSGEVSDHVISDQQTLDQLEAAVCGCMRCPLGSTRTKFVFGEGDPSADIMFVGEAPGADEDRQGKPFIGRAGKLLTDMIIAMKLSRETVFIGNILKCRPPNNRDPKSEEIEACEPILLRQIEIIKPRIICALGRISGQTLLRTTASLGALRGKFHDYHGVKLIVTYHPAALLRNPHWKRPTWDDLKMLRREYDGLEL